MKRVLMLASVASMIDQFNMSNINILKKLGYLVDVACNFEMESTCNIERVRKLRKNLKEMNVRCFQVDFSRDIINISKNIKAFWQIEYLMSKNQYTFVHCHSPIGGVVARIAGKATKTKVIYTAHGFHFFEGAPKKNWLIYYPIEKICSYMTDVLITINKEDYKLARKKMKAKRIIHIRGVGVDTMKFNNITKSKYEIRMEMGIPKNAFVILSVGELNVNKNHQVIIKALAKLRKDNIYYVICGQGPQKEYLRNLAKMLGIENKVQLLGFREDVKEIYHAADIFAFPSKREGLGVAAIEAMASGLPLITSNKHGIMDYSENGISGYYYEADDVLGFANGIIKLLENDMLRVRMGNNNKIKAQNYDINKIEIMMKSLYMEMKS